MFNFLRNLATVRPLRLLRTYLCLFCPSVVQSERGGEKERKKERIKERKREKEKVLDKIDARYERKELTSNVFSRKKAEIKNI